MNIIRKNGLAAAGLVTVLISSLVITGWILHIPLLTSVSPDFISMKFNTALCFFFMGIALLNIGKQNGKKPCVICLIIVILISVLTLMEYIYSINIGIDELFWKEGPGTPYTVYPGRPSALTAVNFLLLSFVLFSIRNRKIFLLSWLALFISLLIAAVSIISYFFGNPELISIPSLTVIALHTALLFLVICTAIYYSDFFRQTAISFQRRMIGGFLVIAFVILLVVYLDNKTDKRVGKTADLILNHTESIKLADDIITNLTKMESGVRGYLLIRDSSLLKPAMEKKYLLEQQLEQLKYHVARHPDQQQRIDTLRVLLANRITLLDSSLAISARQVSVQNNLRNILVRTPYLMNRIVAVLNDLKKREQELVDEVQAKTNQQNTNANNAIKFLGFTILAIFLSLVQLIFRTIKARTEAEANALQLAATLEQKVKERTAQLHRLAAHLQDKREDEQRQLSREVNDEIGQLASAVKMDIDWLALHITTDADPKVSKRISNASKILQTLIDDVRKMASSLRPVMIDELGLNASIKWLCDQFAKKNGIPCIFTEEMDDTGIEQHVRNELYRICEESLINVTQHAQAKQVTVRLLQLNGSIELSITDDGNGFDADHDSGQLGLIGIRERVLSINGSLRIATAKGRGTSVYVTVPVT